MVLAATHTGSHAFTNTHTCRYAHTHTHTRVPMISWLTVFSLWTNIQPWATIKYYSLLSTLPSSPLLSIWCPYHNSAQPFVLCSTLSLSLPSSSLPLFLPSPSPVCAEGGYHLALLSNKLKWLLFGVSFCHDLHLQKQAPLVILGYPHCNKLL